MLFVLCLLFTGGICPHVADAPVLTVLQNSVATLPCPHAAGDVSWSRLRNGDHVILVTVTNGHEDRRDKRCGSLADNSLVISSVRRSDSAWYFCNRKQTVYLEVTPGDGTDSETRPVDRSDSETRPVDRSDSETRPVDRSDPETRPVDRSGRWKVPVGVVLAAALVLLVFTLRSCSGGTADRNGDRPEAEVIYEEIRPPGGETVYDWSSVTEATASNRNVYSTVNELKVKGRCTDTECTYSFVQNPAQAGNSC